jgi:SpoVK/Ycf46/Vps4 family AAA+-type ATPase
MEDTKHRLQLTVFNTWRNPELTRAYGQRLRGGLLLYGPPGCGKTFLARAVAGELGAAFVSIGLTDILDMFFGESEKNLTRIFQSARQNSPSVLFFDEIDALGRKRTLRHDAGRELVNVLLSELDGVGSNNDDIFVIAATNHPWDIDVALRRPGRLDRTLFIPPPDQPARRALFELAMRQRPVASLDFDGLAGRTHGWSGADIVHLCNSATEIALAKALDQNRVEPIAMEHLRTGLSSIKPSVRSWFETARNFALFANAAGDWDDLLAYMKAERMV